MSCFRHWAVFCVALGTTFTAGCSDDPPPPVAVISTVAEAMDAAGGDAGTCGGAETIDAQVGTAPAISGACSTDPSDELLEYSWALVDAPTGSLSELHDATLVRPTFVPDIDGKYVLRLVVTAGSRESEPVFMDVITSAVCGVSRPVADAVMAEPGGPVDCGGAAIPVTATADGEILLDASGSVDPDNNAICGLNQRLDYRWEVLSTPINAGSSNFRNANAEATVFDARENGAYSVRLIVSDELGFESDPVICNLDVTGVVN